MKKRILACGEVLWDLFPEGARFGGAPANFACHAALLGADVSLLSAVGTDPRGEDALAILARFGIDLRHVQRIENARTGSVGVTVDAAGKPSYEIHANAAWDCIRWTTSLAEHLVSVDAIYFGTLGQRSAESRAAIRLALKQAESRGIVRVCDINLRKPFTDPEVIRDSVALATVLKVSDEELHEVLAACGLDLVGSVEAQLQRLRAQFDLAVVALTRGPDGALLVSADTTVDQPGIPTAVRDTVGAGDSFTATLVVGLLRGDSLPVIARRACEVASAVCAQDGAVPASISLP